MAIRDSRIIHFIQESLIIYPDLVAVFATPISHGNLFNISAHPEAEISKDDRRILGHIFSQDIAKDIRVFGLINPPPALRKDKYTCWSIASWGLIQAPQSTLGNDIEAFLVLDELGSWTVYNSGRQSLDLGERRILNSQWQDIPKYGNISLVFGANIKAHLYLLPAEYDIFQKLPYSSLHHSDTEVITEILTSLNIENLDGIKPDSTQETMSPISQQQSEVIYSKEVSESFSPSAIKQNLLFENKNTIINWRQSHTSQVRIVIKTVLKPTSSSWIREMRMERLKHVRSQTNRFIANHLKPHIIRLWYHRTNPHRLFLEYLPAARDLSKFQIDNRCILSYEETIQIFEQIASALAYLHGLKLAHNDIKLENIIYSREYGAKLIDFGLCLPFGDPPVGGTTGYIAPEISFGRLSKPVSHTQDVYGLGIVIYWLLGIIPMPAIFWKLHTTQGGATILRVEHHFEERESYMKNWDTKNNILKETLLLMCHEEVVERPQALHIYNTVKNMI